MSVIKRQNELEEVGLELLIEGILLMVVIISYIWICQMTMKADSVDDSLDILRSSLVFLVPSSLDFYKKLVIKPIYKMSTGTHVMEITGILVTIYIFIVLVAELSGISVWIHLVLISIYPMKSGVYVYKKIYAVYSIRKGILKNG
ncbi:MAG: hypothetical protein R3Y24_09155 [Eubacteriales bacterium]